MIMNRFKYISLESFNNIWFIFLSFNHAKVPRRKYMSKPTLQKV